MSAMCTNLRRPELLAPAGDWDALRAAVANGADAVYFGLELFNARFRATNFRRDELPEVMAFLRRHNVRGYITFNTLIFSDELPEAVSFLKDIAAAGVDAVIVQDLGLVRLIKRLVPSLPVHGSTQMTLTDARGIEYVRRLGVERVILARELSLADIRKIVPLTPMPVEVFVHGALCVAYSGQCLTSESLGGRSANRGQCAQACRMPYELIVDDRKQDLDGKAYLLSPLDLMAAEQVQELADAGVVSVKIEGRLKGAPYVAQTTQTYRRAIDAAVSGIAYELPLDEKRDLAQVYSRGFAPGFLDGVDHQRLVAGRFPKNRGVRVGTVVRMLRRGVEIQPDNAAINDWLKPGDGVVFDQGRPEENEQGGRIFEIIPNSRHGRVEVYFAPGDVELSLIHAGDIVWKTDDPALRKRLTQTFATDNVVHRIPLKAILRGRLDQSLELTMTDPEGRQARAVWAGPLAPARSRPWTPEVLREQLGRLGNSPFELCTVEADLPQTTMIPLRVLNELRREVVGRLIEQRDRGARHGVADPSALESLRTECVRESPASPLMPRLHLLARTRDQFDAALQWQFRERSLATVYCEFEDVKRYRDAVAAARAADIAVGLATLRVVKPGEDGFLRALGELAPEIVLARSLSAIRFFREHFPAQRLLGDFSLNAANELTADLLLSDGLDRIVPSYDLNWEQFAAMVRRLDPSRLEAVIHQHMPMFHNEHCVFAAVLSDGKDWRDCGRPCDYHRVELRDRTGATFPLLADAGCRNTVFNAIPQSAAEYLTRMMELGLGHFRIELLRETPEQVHALLDRYSRVLSGEDDGRGLWRHLQAMDQLGVTRGTLRLA
jgi:putative protease